MKSLYERIGGEPAVDAAVDLFYKKVLEDDRINLFFEGVDMDKMHRMQKGFLTFAFGGTTNYSGKGMEAAHRKLVKEKGLNESHFDAVIENLGATLTDLGVPDDLIQEAASIAVSVKNPVLGLATD